MSDWHVLTLNPRDRVSLQRVVEIVLATPRRLKDETGLASLANEVRRAYEDDCLQLELIQEQLERRPTFTIGEPTMQLLISDPEHVKLLVFLHNADEEQLRAVRAMITRRLLAIVTAGVSDASPEAPR